MAEPPLETRSTSSAKFAIPRYLEYRRRQAAGLAILTVIIAVFSLWRAGLTAIFPHGWWHVW